MSPDDSPSVDGNKPLPNYAERRAETPLHPNRCGPCEDCSEFLAERADVDAYVPRGEKRKKLLFLDHSTPDLEPGAFRLKRLDGSWTTLPAPSYSEFVRHAQRFGVSEVFEAAEQSGLPAAQLAELKPALRKIASGEGSRFGPKPKTAAVTAEDIRALYDAERTPEEIAVQVGWKLPRVRKALREEP